MRSANKKHKNVGDVDEVIPTSGHELRVVGDDDNDLPSGREITDEVSDRGEVTKIGTRCGLVEDDEVRPA